MHCGVARVAGEILQCHHFEHCLRDAYLYVKLAENVVKQRDVHTEVDIFCVFLDEIPAFGYNVHQALDSLLAFL